MSKLVKFIFIFVLLISKVPVLADDDYLLQGDYKNAYIEYKSALDKEKTAFNYLNMCKVTYYLNDNKAAKQYCNAAMNIMDAQKKPDIELKSDILSMIGNIYANAYHNRSITFDYYNQAKELKESNSNTDKYELAKLYLNMAYVYHNMGEYFLTKDSLDKALEISKNNDLKKYRVIESAIYNDLGLIEKENNNYLKSKEYFEKSLEVLISAEEYLNQTLNSIINYNLALYYESCGKKKDKELAKVYYTYSLKSANYNIIEQFKNYDTFAEFDFSLSKKKEIEERLSIFPYDSIGLYEGAVYELIKENDDLAQDRLDKLISVNNDCAVANYLVSLAYAIAYERTKDLAYQQQSKKYLKIFMKKSLNYDDKYKYLMAGRILLQLQNKYNADKNFKKYKELSDSKLQAEEDIKEIYRKTNYKKKAFFLNKYIPSKIKDEPKDE